MSLSAKRYLFGRQTTPYLDKLVAYWKLAENANDSSGRGHNGTGTSMTYSSGYAEFDPGYILVPDANDFSFTDGTNDLKASFFIPFYWDDKTGNQYIISKRSAAADLEWQIIQLSSSIIFRFINPSSTTDYIQISIPNSGISTGFLNTLYFHYDGSKLHTGLSAFLNGNNAVGTTSMSGTYAGQVNSASALYLGIFGSTLGLGFKGKGKEWAVWKGRDIFTGTQIDDLDYRVRNGIPLI